MDKYIPFLKFKKNEVMAVKELPIGLKEQLTPFFDIPRRPDQTEDNFKKQINDAVSDCERHLSDVESFYLDNFDIDDDRLVDGQDSYEYVLERFADLPVIPVVGLDRTAAHIQAICKAIDAGYLQTQVVGLRLNRLDYEDYGVAADEIDELFEKVCSRFEAVHLILDMRVINAGGELLHAQELSQYALQFNANYPCGKTIITGSVLPASVAEIVGVDSEVTISRAELMVFRHVAGSPAGQLDLWLGDYATVSPDYSDVDMPPEMLRNVTAPKIIYSFDDHHYVRRGRALRQYGNGQYNDMSDELVNKSFYRGAAFSWGDNFYDEKARGIGSQVTPSTIVRPGVNAHMNYMLTAY